MITTGMTPFISGGASASRLPQPWMTSSMAATLLAQRSATTVARTRLEWRPAQSGWLAATWTVGCRHPAGTSSAWNFSWRLTQRRRPEPRRSRPAPDITINSWVARHGRVLGNTLQLRLQVQGRCWHYDGGAAGNFRIELSTTDRSTILSCAHLHAGALNTGTDTIAFFSSAVGYVDGAGG